MTREESVLEDWIVSTVNYAVGSYAVGHYPIAVEHSSAETIGAALQEIRKATGRKQHDTAYALGWSRQKVSDIERGVVEVGFLEVARMCSLYGVTPYNVLAYGEERSRVE